MGFVLMFYLWTSSVHAGAVVTMHDFTSEDRCKEAGARADKEFSGLASKAYWVCLPK